MAIKAAELQVVIGADTNPAVQGIKGAMGLIGNAASTALGVFSGTLMTQAVGALGNLASAGVQAVGEFERMSATLGTLVKRDLARTGDSMELAGQKTKELLNWVQQLAKESPFDASGVTVALRTAMTYGFTAEQAQRLTKAMIDFAAGSGQSADVMNSIALALGQIQMRGKLAGQEMLQLVNAGIDVKGALVKYLGKSTQEVAEMLEKGKIDAITAIEAIVSTLEKDYGGAAKEQSQTVSGLISTFEELKQMGLRELFMGIVEAVRPLAGAFLDWLQEEGIARMREIGVQIGNLTARAIEFVQNAAPTFQAVMQWISDNGATIQGALTGIAIAFGAMAVVSTVTALVTALANPLTLVIALAGLLGAAWANNWGGIQEKTAAVWAWLQTAFANVKAWLQETIPQALATLNATWANIWGAIQRVVSVVFPIIQSIFRAFSAAFRRDWEAFGSYLRDAWDALWKLQMQILNSAWTSIKTTVSNLVTSIKDFFANTDWAAVGKAIIDGIVNGISNGAKSLADAAANAAKAALAAARGFLKARSPSRLFEEMVGVPMMEGWIRGIVRTIPALELATASAGMRAYSTAKNVTNNYYLTVQSMRSSEQIAQDFWLMRI